MIKSTIRFKALLVFTICVSMLACKKSSVNVPANNNGGGITPPVITPPVDPGIAGTIGFFLDDWKEKSFVVPAYTDVAAPSDAAITVSVDASDIITKVPGPFLAKMQMYG